MRFRATILLDGKTATGIPVPDAEGAEKAETRERRITKAIRMLREGRKQG